MTNEIYSKRQKQLRGEIPDVYRYDLIPKTLRVQLTQIFIDDGIGDIQSKVAVPIFDRICKRLRREYGCDHLSTSYSNSINDFSGFLRFEENVERVLDCVELCCQAVNLEMREHWVLFGKEDPDQVLKEVNQRFREHGVGYKFESNQIIRVDSELVHAEVVIPALKLLAKPEFKGPNEEFLKAHDHYPP